MPTIHWFRRDLRLADNPALLAAVASARAGGDDRVVPLFVVDPHLWNGAGEVRRATLVGSLRALDARLNDQLLLHHDRPEVAVVRVAQAAGATEVHVTADFSPYGAARDQRVEGALAREGITLIRTGSPYAVAPGRVLKSDGTPYRVYTPFYKAWLAHGWRSPAEECPSDVNWWMPIDCHGYPPVSEVPGALLPFPGELSALERWDHFSQQAVFEYGEQRNRPDIDGTSLLSASLKWGEIHPRTLLADLNDSEGAEVFRKEIAWREFYADVLHHNHHSVTVSLDERFTHMEYESGDVADQRFEAWCAGRTGYPFVDAGMRQLISEGWMHNRVRMVVASFLVKDLHLPWWWGAQWFMRHLRDGDIASNTHGWQWTAGCGTDAAPYFRIFNPITQGLRFDPAGSYVRAYVPELSHIAGKAAHEPWLVLDGLSQGYPERIVDHAVERDEALRRFASLPPRANAG